MRNSLIAFCVLTMLSGAAQAQKKKMVCWTDDKGVRACGDVVPPQYAKKEREVRNERGVVVERLAGEKTAEQLQAEAQALEAARVAMKAADYDRYLQQSFSKVIDLEAARDERLLTVKSRLRLAERALIDTEETLVELRARADKLRAENKPIDAKLSKNIQEFERGLVDSRAAIAALKAERESLKAKFESDIVRYRQLRGLPPEQKLDAAALVAGAQELFAKYVEFYKTFDPKLSELYAPSAVISQRRIDSKGAIKELEIAGRDWRKQLREAMPVAQERQDQSTFTEVRYVQEDYRVRISGLRFSEWKKFSSPFSLLVGPNSDGRWFIYEERIETKQ